MEALKLNTNKVDNLAAGVVEDLKKRSATTKLLVEDYDQFKIVTYVDGKPIKIGIGWLNIGTGERPHIYLDKDKLRSVVMSKTRSPDAYLFPYDKREKKENAK